MNNFELREATQNPLVVLSSTTEFDLHRSLSLGFRRNFVADSPLEVLSPYNVLNYGKRPTSGLPHPTVLRLRAFSAS